MPSRLEKMRQLREDEDYHPDMPPIECGGYLLAYFWEVGPTMPGGMSSGPLTHLEILGWSMLMGVSLEPWEARCLRRLSLAYVNESHKAEKIDAKAPWLPESYEPEHLRAVSKSLRESMRELAALKDT